METGRSNINLVKMYGYKNCDYRMRAIISRDLYIFYPISKDQCFVFKEVFFQKILSLCLACIQEQLLIKRGLWWRAYGIRNFWRQRSKIKWTWRELATLKTPSVEWPTAALLIWFCPKRAGLFLVKLHPTIQLLYLSVNHVLS